MANKPKFLDATKLHELFSYDPETGLVCLKVASRKNPAGYVFGRSDPADYIRLRFEGSSVSAARAIWVMQTGEQPIVIDHVNGVPRDNRWKNLRSVSVQENSLNRPAARIKAGKPGPLDTSESEYGQHYS